MCDDQLVQKMKSLQLKPKTLHCTQSSLCWCNDLSFRFPMEQIQDECMSPRQMLESCGDQMTKKDQAYLKGLLDREFIID